MERSRFGWNRGNDDPGLEGGMYGGALGPVLLTPLSVYLANRRQGSLAAFLAVSAGISAVGIAGVASMWLKAIWGKGGTSTFIMALIIFAPPVAQAFSAALIAARTSKR
jgi:hypothetical protein